MILTCRPAVCAGRHGVGLAVLAVWLASSAPLLAQSYAMTRFVVAAGGGASAAAPLILVGTAGQAAAGGPLGGGPYTVVGGFWPGAAYQPFTDPVLTAGSSLIRAVHITELRMRVDALRVRYGQAAFVWTDPTLTPGATVIRAQHILDLRTALAEAYVAAGLPPPTYTDPSLLAGTVARVAHIAELRANILAIE
jgi:hypothetical protein